MDYFETLVKAMDILAENENTLFIGQSVVWDGHAIFKTMVNVPVEKKIEMPVIEDSQMGFCTGLALEGFIPISIFPRWDFAILATNQMVNHLDKIPLIGHGMLKPKVIIRISAAARFPLDPGPQHCQDHSAAFKCMFSTIELINLLHKDEILPAYDKALNRTDGRSTMIVEHASLYHIKA